MFDVAVCFEEKVMEQVVEGGQADARCRGGGDAPNPGLTFLGGSTATPSVNSHPRWGVEKDPCSLGDRKRIL